MPGSPIGQQHACGRIARNVVVAGREETTRGTNTRGTNTGSAGGAETNCGEGVLAASGGNVGPVTRRGIAGRGALTPPSRRIGDGRGGRFNRCALPTTAFLEMAIRRPISAVE